MNPLKAVDNKKTFIFIALWTLAKVAESNGWVDYETSSTLQNLFMGGGAASLKHSWDKKHATNINNNEQGE